MYLRRRILIIMHLNCIKNLQTEKYSYDYYDIAISYVFFKGNYI